MNATAWSRGLEVTGGGTGVVSHTGLVLARQLTDRTGLAGGLSAALPTPDGGLDFADGVSGPGKYVEMRACMDVIVLISNCPQLNNPCNAYNPTPIEILLWDPA